MPEEAYRETASVGRDWDAETRAGFHATPSIANSHIHIILTKFCNNTGQLWTGREYLAIGTEFFTTIHEVPLATDDPRQRGDKALLSCGELVYWRCWGEAELGG
jgi:aprataxin